MVNHNNYDKFASIRQKHLIGGEKLPHRFVEKPMMEKLLPNLKGKTVLLLGCGTGEESIMIEKFGAKEIAGIDISRESVRIAKKSYPKSKFMVGDINNLKFNKSSFDFVYSSLSIHYSKNPKKVYKEVMRVLKPGGKFLFSLAHPVRWASKDINIGGEKIKAVGYSDSEKELYGNYLSFKKHEHHFPSGEILSFWVGPPSLHYKLLKEAGFIIEDFVESQVIPECKKKDLWYYKKFSELPQFMAFLIRKP